MKGLKNKKSPNKGSGKKLSHKLKAKSKNIKLSNNVKEKIVSEIDNSSEWTVPKKTTKINLSKPKKVKDTISPKCFVNQSNDKSTTPRLYIRFPKSLERMQLDHNKLLTLHPNIIDVRIPRKKLHSKWFFAVFETKEKAIEAKEDLLAEGGCVVTTQFDKIDGEKKKKTKKPEKESFIRDWTME